VSDADTSDYGFDTTVAHSARRYNYWLDGKDNFAADRLSGDAIAEAFPSIRLAVRENRAFLKRSVEFLAREAGIRQFLDIGTGLPTADNTHEVAQAVAPGSRIVYVDNDPIVLTHARALLTSSAAGATAYLDADLQVMSHATYDPMPPAVVTQLRAAIARTGEKGGPRDHDQFARFFTGLELVGPGIVPVGDWRPTPGRPGARPGRRRRLRCRRPHPLTGVS
jgi:hypothetical protein